MAPRFKKLTDCPENLREAIDWLIQVRHGGDKTGIQKLAKALKELIGAAINKANDSFEKRKNQLNCPEKYYTNPDVSYCTKQNDEINKLKTDRNSITSENDLALLKLESDLKKHLDEDHDLSKDARQNALKDIDGRQKQLADMKKNLTGLTNEDQCVNLLTDLCSGLETFLGFNPESKGYTGQGIVYSDLDRLCDAVMAFLLGVLESVKDYIGVKQYDDYIEAESAKLDKVLTSFKPSIGKGYTVFGEQVTAVSRWLGSYYGEVCGKTEAVITQLGNLNKEITDKIMNIKTGYENIVDVEERSRRLSEWVNNANERFHTLLKSVYESVHILDAGLREQLRVSLDKIKIHIDSFSKSTVWDECELKELFGKLEIEMEKLEESVMEEVDKQVKELKESLQNEFKNIVERIKEVNRVLNTVRSDLQKWIQQAKLVVTAALGKCKEILGKVDDGAESTEKKAVRDAAEILQIDANALWRAVDQAKGGLENLARNIRGKVSVLEKVYRDTLKAMQQAVQKQVIAAQQSLQGLETQVIHDLKDDKFQGPIKEDVKKVIQSLQGAISNAGNALTHGSGDSLVQEFYLGLQNSDDVPQLKAWAKQAMSGGQLKGTLAGLHSVFRVGDFTEFKPFLVKFPHLTEQVDGKNITLFDAIIADLGTKLTGAIQGITRNLSGKMPKYYAHAKKQPEGTIYKAIEHIKKDVDDYFEAADGSGQIKSGKLKDFNDDRKNKNKKELLTEEIKKIHTDGFDVLDAVVDCKGHSINKDTFSTQFRKFADNLGEFAGTVRTLIDKTGASGQTEGKGVQTLLLELQKMLTEDVTPLGYDLAKNIDGIKSDIENILGEPEPGNLQGNLKDILTAAETFLKTTIPNKSKECIKAILDNFSDKLYETTKNIQKDAIERFMKVKQIELNDLANNIKNLTDTIEKDIEYNKNNGIKGLLVKMKEHSEKFDDLSSEQDKSNIGKASVKVESYLRELLMYIYQDVRKLFNAELQSPPKDPYTPQVENIYNKLSALLTHFAKSEKIYNFDSTFSQLLIELEDDNNKLNPSTFSEIAIPCVEIIRQGLKPFITQISFAYMNSYSDEQSEQPYDSKYAKICLTVVHMLFRNLHELFYNCSTRWKGICIDGVGKEDGALKQFLTNEGFDIVNLINKEHSGWNVAMRLSKGFRAHKEFNASPHPSHVNFPLHLEFIRGSMKAENVLGKLFSYLETYYKVKHYATSSSNKHPCSVFEMLLWLAGLEYNVVYGTLMKHIRNLYKTPDNYEFASALKNCVTYDIYNVSTYALKLLSAILGTGNAATHYASEYCDNSFNLHYPPDPAACFDIFVEILRRMLPLFRFLHSQCALGYQYNGWSDCLYGRDIPTANSQCDQHTNYTTHCQPTSPLMCYLNDCLPGYMPHDISSIGCRPVCSTCHSKSQGMPCLTPLGFRGFSGITRKGEYLCVILDNLFDNVNLSPLLCVAPKPPSTLPEHFGFAIGLVRVLTASTNKTASNANAIHSDFAGVFATSIKSRSIQLYNEPTELTNALSNAYGAKTANHNKCQHPHLISVTTAGICKGKDEISHRIPFLSTLFSDSYSYLTNKHAEAYLSWVVYLPWQLHNQLKCLVESLKDIFCREWGCRGCMNSTKCKKGEHGVHKSACQCRSIVSCKGVAPTLYQHGFTIQDVYTVMSENKSCFTFQNYLSGIMHSQYIIDLFETCDMFLWKIRFPFMTLTLTLWLLSFLYLLHIMVVRLDLLHIKSHLHSPSSHRIAAQSLLAAARVGKLAKLTYLQP